MRAPIAVKAASLDDRVRVWLTEHYGGDAVPPFPGFAKLGQALRHHRDLIDDLIVACEKPTDPAALAKVASVADLSKRQGIIADLEGDLISLADAARAVRS